MCVIAISPKGTRQPTETEFRSMWSKNPDGSGYMFVRKGRVEIHKGFVIFDDFIRSVRSEKFTESDAVIYHFRIATQGYNPSMTHPFPLTAKKAVLKAFDVLCDIGIVHNGIIPITTKKDEKEYSDTALFISEYMTKLIRSVSDMQDKRIQEMIEELICSKMAMMDCNGNIVTIGKFYNHDGILLSNENHLIDWTKYYTGKGAKGYVYPSSWQEKDYCF